MQHSLITFALLLTLPALAQQSNTRFSHTLETSASATAIWRVWTDVPNWKTWDDGLKAAELNGPFATGSTGMLVPDKGPEAKFMVTEVIAEQSHTFRTNLPLGSLYVRRLLTNQNG